VVLALMGASGFASLGYQIVWTQQSAVWLGHETAAVLAVVAAFFGGLALGAIALGDRIEQSAVPQRWYAACEAAIAVWSVALAVLMNPLGEGLLDLIGAQPSAMWHWMAAFCGTFALLLPATVAMGATLPAMERVIAKLQMQSQRSGQPGGHAIGALYASNTVGAVVGVLATAFWLIPTFGLLRTAGLCAAINLACAAAALGLRSEGTPTIAPTVAPSTPAGRTLAATLMATGLLGIGYEVLVVRVLSQVTEDTVYTFAMLLAVYLAGTALGAAAYQRWGSGKQGSTVPPDSETDPVRDRLLGLLAVASLLATLGLYGAPALKAFALDAMGPGMTAALGAEAALALAAFGLPTVVMGALFSHLTVQARATGLAFSRSLAFNTLGAAAAPLLFGVLLLPALGPKLALLGVAGGYLALSSPSAWRAPWVWVPAAMTLALALLAPPLMFIDTPAGGHVVSYREGAMSSVSVIEDARGVMRLRIDNRQQEGSSDSRVADARQALLPLLLHPAPKQALFLGLGTGVTSFSAAEDPSLQVDVVELLPEVIAASDHFTRGLTNGKATPHLKLMAADARRYVRAASKQYDVIVSDNFHPARSGSAALYTVEHFQAVQKRLAAGGLFCQWLPLHQLDLDSLRAVVQAFMAVYPDGWAMLATNSLETPVMGLVGRVGATHFDGEQMHARLAAATWPQALADFGLPDEMAVMGNFIAGPQSLVRFAGNAPANTDDHPVVAYSAPRITYAPDSLPRDRLVSLLQALGVTPEDLRRATPDAATRQRLAAYWDARNRYIVIGRTVRPSGNVENMLAQVREPLLSVLRTSPDFRPAYDPLLRMATALTQINATQGRKLLTELAQVQPKRPEAAQALRELNGN
jgi:spermidine synthase